MEKKLKDKIAKGIQQLDEGKGEGFRSFLIRISKKYRKKQSPAKLKKTLARK